jgi:hypothetical protein
MKIFERGRRILRTVFRGMSVSVVSLILQACYDTMSPDNPGGAYGMPAPAYGMPPYESIYGRVVAQETGKPIFGIQISVEETEYWDYTDKSGWFSFHLPIQEVYKLKFKDVDGPYHGGLFKEQTWTLNQGDTYNLLIGMDTDTETETNEE